MTKSRSPAAAVGAAGAQHESSDSEPDSAAWLPALDVGADQQDGSRSKNGPSSSSSPSPLPRCRNLPPLSPRRSSPLAQQVGGSMEKPGAPTSGHPAPEARATRGSSVEEKGAATVDSPLEAKGAAMGAAISHCRSPSLSRTRLTKEKPRLMDWKGAASSDSTMEEKGAASSESTMEEKGATSSDSTMEEKGATMGEATRASPLKEKRPRRPMPRPLTCAQWWRREDASLRKRTRQMMELFPDFNPDEEYAYSNSENLSGWESGSDDGADEVMSHVMANSAPPVTVVPDQNIKPGNEDKQRGKVVEEEGEGELSNTMTVQDGGFTNPAGAEGGSGHGGWVTVRKYDGGRPQLRRRIGK